MNRGLDNPSRADSMAFETAVDDQARQSRPAVNAARGAAWLVVAGYGAQVVTLFLSLGLRRVLGPAGMGFIALAQLAATYAPLLSLGVAQAAEREIAREFGRGDDPLAGRLERTAGAVMLALGMAVLGLAILVAWIALDGPPASVTVIVVGAVVLSQQIAIWATFRLRTRGKFRTLGIWGAIGQVGFIALPLLGALTGGLSWALVGVAAGSALQAALLGWRSRITVRPRLDAAVLGRLTRIAPGFLTISLSATLLSSVDQLAVSVLLGPTALGLYSTAYLGNLFLMRVPNLIGSVIFPLLQKEIGARRDPARVGSIARRVTGTLVIALPLLTAALEIFLPATVHVALPAYREAIPAMRLLLVGVTGLAIAMPATQVLITLDRQWALTRLNAGFAGAMVIAYVGAHLWGRLTIDVAAGVDVVVYALYGVAAQYVGTRSVPAPKAWLPGIVATAYVPMLALLGGAWAADQLLPPVDAPALAAGLVLQAVLFVLVWAAMASRFVRSNEVVRADLGSMVDVVTTRIRQGLRRGGR